MRRPRIAAFFLSASALAAVGVSVGAAGVGEATAPRPPYFVDAVGVLGSGYDIGSNSLWRGVGGTRGAARELGGAQFTGDSSGADRHVAVWAAVCSAKKQTVRFARDVELLGPPGSLEVEFRPIGAGATAFKLRVNGKPALSTTETFDRIQLGPVQRSLFRIGRNELEVALTKPPGKCAGVAFRIRGYDSADLYTGQGEKLVYQRGGPATNLISVKNLGPDVVPRGEFYFSTNRSSGHGLEFRISLTAPSPFGTCETVDKVNRYDVTCPFTNFAPGASATVTAVLQFTPQSPSFDYAAAYLNWGIRSVNGPADPDSSNDQRAAQIFFCGPASTQSGCANLPK